MMDFFIKKANSTLQYGEISPSTTSGSDYMKWELHVQDVIFILYMTNYGPGDFGISVNTGINLDNYCNVYNQLEDIQISLLHHNISHLASITDNTARKIKDSPFFSACDIVNDNYHTWPVNLRFELSNDDNYVRDTMLPFCMFATKMLWELYDCKIPFVEDLHILSTKACENKDLVNHAYRILSQYF